jgi:4-amino-4-deoxy-L-arabinose transferase-like glycosyltransferase
MAEPVLPDSIAAARQGRSGRAPGTLMVVIEIALAVRILAAQAIEWYVRRGGSDRLCLFPDTDIYWELARTIRAGAPYQIVEWGDIPHFALRTPGYPIVLAGCQALFGERTLAVRLVQAVLGTISVYLVYRLCRQLASCHEPARVVVEPDRSTGIATMTDEVEPAASKLDSLPLLAATIAALHPYYIFMSVIMLSEAIFVPLMLAALWSLAVLWPRSCRAKGTVSNLDASPGDAWSPLSAPMAALVSLGGGGAAGLAVLARPSWALFVPGAAAVWVLSEFRVRRGPFAARGAILWLCGAALVMCPWWARNAQVYGRFVPTALWLGASLHDGLNPRATGASDMSFLGDPDVWSLDEQDQDVALTQKALRYARENPGRALALAVVKLGRFWSPWPNAEGFRSLAVTAGGLALELPLFGLFALGAWKRRRDLRVWVLAAGPLIYFSALHLVFASSTRYRIPAEMPALALAACGWLTLGAWRRKSTPRGCGVRLSREA